MNVTRRQLLGWTTASLGAVGGAAACLSRLRVQPEDIGSFGALEEDPNGLFDLPKGFRYRVLAETGMVMNDGNRRRPLPDGMAAFPGPNGEVILMINHEISLFGGVSRLVLDPSDLSVISSNDVLLRTNRNCAGGPSPWGWLSCEEVERGGVWVCPTDANAALSGAALRRVDDYGTFRHEAVCINPSTSIAYLTEDDGPSHLYRMLPHDAESDPFQGRLQALRRPGMPSFDTADMQLDDSFEADWVDVDPKRARASAKQREAAIFHRGEGIWFSDDGIFFTATTHQQLFRLRDAPSSTHVELFANELKSPDNLTVAPWGDVFVAEDQRGNCRLRVVDAQGQVGDFARNVLSPGQELAGVCFSPDGRTLFVNLQKSGHTLAVTGPFPSVEPRG